MNYDPTAEYLKDVSEKLGALLAGQAAQPEPPADKIPFSGTGPELADRIIQTHIQAIGKARASGKKMRRISNNRLILDEVPRYYRDKPGSKNHGGPFNPENVRTSWLRSKQRTRRGY